MRDAKPGPDATVRRRREWPFVLGLSVVGGSYVLLIVALLAADLVYLLTDKDLGRVAPGSGGLWGPEIRYATFLSMVSCGITAILSVWVAVPMGYLLSRFRFPLKSVVDAAVDIPIVLPPLVIGLSLLIFFQTPVGRAIESVTRDHMGFLLVYVGLPLTVLAVAAAGSRLLVSVIEAGAGWLSLYGVPLATAAACVGVLALTSWGPWLSAWAQRRFGTEITYAIPSVILAQFSVAAAFAVRTMRVTFDQITPRREQVARTLGCTRSQAFWLVALPEAWHGIVTAGTIAWARALGEFGPVLVFSGATRMRTEVLPTTIFLELSVGSLGTAVAVSLAMVAVAVVVLVVVRLWGQSGQQQL